VRPVFLPGSLSWWILVIVIALFGTIFTRWFRRTRISKKPESVKTRFPTLSKVKSVKRDSPFYELQDQLIKAGYFKNRWESPGEWIVRLSQTEMKKQFKADLLEIVRQHYKLRFHPKGLTDEEMKMMEHRCRDFQANFSAAKIRAKEK
jgi:hypothetical protein